MTPATLARIHATAFTQERSWTAKEFRDLIASPHNRLTTATHGFALWRTVSDEAELLTIAVDQNAQNKGVGRHLMEVWMGRAASTASSAFLEVAADNYAALALYAKFYFQTVSIRPNYYKRHNGHVDALLMRVTLPYSVA